MGDELKTSNDAALAFKDDVNTLMTGLQPIVHRYDPKGAGIPNLTAMLSGAGGAGGLMKVFEQSLTPTQKFTFVQAWARSMDARVVIEQFIGSTGAHWTSIESGNEAALLSVIDGLSIPGSAANFLRSLYEKKDLLTAKERGVILEYVKNFCYYGQLYEQMKTEEKGRKK